MITNNGTKNNLKSSQLPTGYTRPTVVVFNDGKYKSTELQYVITKSTVENADNATTMANIVTSITSSVDADLAADYIASNTVDAFCTLDTLTINYGTDGGGDEWLSDAVASYTCNVTLYVKIS